jgi:hypothetical protein
MTNVAKGLITHTVVIVVGKRERAIAMETLLKKLSCKVIVATSLYEALKVVTQEMPHMIISEAELADGSAASLYDKLESIDLFKGTPIVVNVLKKTRSVLEDLSKRKFAGFFLGKLDPKSFLKKSIEILNHPTKPSPFYKDIKGIGIDGKFNLNFSGKVIGKTEEHLVIKSSMEIDSKASLVCVPQSANYAPILVRQGSNLQKDDDILNLFPIGKVSGKGRAWLKDIPDYETKVTSSDRRKILFYDPSEERFAQFEEILNGYDIEALHAPSLKRAFSYIKQRPDAFGAIYLHELMNDASSIEFKKVFDALPESIKPKLLVGTTSINLKNTPSIRYIRRPFGLGEFLETIQSCFERADEIVGQATQTGFVGIDVSFQAPAHLIGVDEEGGVIQVKFPVVKGARISVPHKLIEALIESDSFVDVTNVAQVQGEANLWQVRFSAVGSGSSKSKYFETVVRALAPHQDKATENSEMAEVS